MADSLAPSLSDIVDETYDDSDEVETMTAAQVLAKLEEVTDYLHLVLYCTVPYYELSCHMSNKGISSNWICVS